MIAAAWQLGGTQRDVRFRAWAHMLGYGGHFLTKSRRYPVTFGQFRAARAEHRRATRPTAPGRDAWGRFWLAPWRQSLLDSKPANRKRSDEPMTCKGEWLTVAEILKDLGIPRRTWQRWRELGLAPEAIRLPNRELRIRRSVYDAWLASLEGAPAA